MGDNGIELLQISSILRLFFCVKPLKYLNNHLPPKYGRLDNLSVL